MPTIKDIAAYTGVSPTTVSNVIHGRTAKVSEETKIKVEKALKELNYHSHMAGRLLAKNGSRIIGVIFQEDRVAQHNSDNPYLGEFVQAVEIAIKEAGYFMMFQRVASVDEGVKLVQMWDLEGIILAGTSPRDLSAWLEIAVPIVFVDMYPLNDEPILNIGVDDFQASYTMTNYLIACGHREIAFLAFGSSCERWIGVEAVRAQGTKAALDEHQLAHHFIAVPRDPQKFPMFLQTFAEEQAGKISALFLSSDLLAAQAMSLLYKNNWRVPEDFSLVGFDGTLLSKLATPQITTIYQDILKKAQQGIQLLLAEIAGQEIKTPLIQLETKLIEGASVKKLKNH